MPDQPSPGFLERLGTDPPDALIPNDEPAAPRYRIQAVITELERRGRFPALRFPRVAGATMPVVSNLFASRARLAHALGVPVTELSREVGVRARDALKPVTVTRAPFQDVTHTGADVDLFRLPLVTHYPVDAAPYITAGLVIARHPETGMETA